MTEWAVQFSFDVASSEQVVEAFAAFANAELGDWLYAGLSPAGVHSYVAPFRFAEHDLEMGRLEYSGWETPMFSVDFREPATLSTSEFFIIQLDRSFREQEELGYTLVDYGPIAP